MKQVSQINYYSSVHAIIVAIIFVIINIILIIKKLLW